MENLADRYNEALAIHTDIYPLESIQLAACAFLDDAFFHLSPGGKVGGRLDKINVAIKVRGGGDAALERLAGRFANELNRQSLRIALDRMNRSVRSQIVGRALASAIPSGRTEASREEARDERRD